jgi:predicted transcriptional regulator
MKLLVELEQHPSTLWLRPMDLGARDASYHSATLKRLADQGLVERLLRGTLRNEIGGGRGSYVYKATKLGRQMAKKWLATHSRYEE